MIFTFLWLLLILFMQQNNFKTQILRKIQRAVAIQKILSSFRKSAPLQKSWKRRSKTINVEAHTKNTRIKPKNYSMESLIVRRKQQIQINRWKQVHDSLGSVQNQVQKDQFDYHYRMIHENKGNSLFYSNAMAEMEEYQKNMRTNSKSIMFRTKKLKDRNFVSKKWQIEANQSLAYRLKPFWRKTVSNQSRNTESLQ